VVVSYVLGDRATEEGAKVALEFLDDDGGLVMRFETEPPGRAEMSDDEKAFHSGPWITTKPGVNRFVWDYSLAGPWDANPGRSGRNGPWVAPGQYRLRLTSGEHRSEQMLTVRIDPRNARDGVTLADLREQLEHNLRVRDLVSEANELVARVETVRRRLGDNPQGAAADTRLNAQRKAYTAARSDATSTAALAEKVRDDAVERASFDPFFTFFQGGVAVFREGRRVGALGVSGLSGADDDALARRAIEASGLSTDGS